jgi:hypothetical protein
MHVRKLTFAAALLAALAPAVAAAQPPKGAGGPRLGSYFLAGGGVTEFSDADARDRLGTGGTWDARFGLRLRHFVGGEIAYVGSSFSAGALGSDLLTNGLEGVLRLQYPWERGRWLVEPFAFGGIGWTHFDRNGARDLELEDTVLPVGAGVTLGYGRFLLDTRFTFRHTFDEEILRAADGSEASLDSWALTAAIGYEF